MLVISEHSNIIYRVCKYETGIFENTCLLYENDYNSGTTPVQFRYNSGTIPVQFRYNSGKIPVKFQ